MNDESWISAATAADVLGVPVAQVRHYGATGRLQSKRLGRRVLYLAEDVDRLAGEPPVTGDNVSNDGDAVELPVSATEAVTHAPLDPDVDLALRQLIEGQNRIENRLERIERYLLDTAPSNSRPSGALVIAIILMIVTILFLFVTGLQII
jgi:hypothetical protein